jgi:pyruvate-ferredoxin/flavodoxin oxidoreductase
MKIEELSEEDIRFMINDQWIHAHRARALSPDHPVLRGSAQNPDVFFQAREAGNRFYQACPEIVQQTMNRFATLTGRSYRLFDYVGAPDVERVIVVMGSGAEAGQETVEYLLTKGEKVGLIKVRLFRPFSVAHFMQAIPSTARAIAVLDRTKEPGAIGAVEHLVAESGFSLPRERVAQTGAAAALDADAQARLVLGQALLLDDVLDFLRGRFRQ